MITQTNGSITLIAELLSLDRCTRMWIPITTGEATRGRKERLLTSKMFAAILWLGLALFFSAFRGGWEILLRGGSEWVGFAEFLSRLVVALPVGIAVIWLVPWSRFKSLALRRGCETCGLEPIGPRSVVCECGGSFIDTSDKKWIENETNAA